MDLKSKTEIATKQGRACFNLECIHHPLHKDWVKGRKTMAGVKKEHFQEHGHIWCALEIYLDSDGVCSEFKRADGQ